MSSLTKGLVYFFLAAFLCNSMGNYLIFELNKYLIRREMQSLTKAGIITRRQLVLKISQPEHNPDFQRLDKREIKFRGRLYDIIRETKQGNKTLFLCIHDNKEELLIAGFMKGQHRKITLNLRHSLITQALPWELKAPPTQAGTDFLYPEKNYMADPVFLSLFAPPPEIA